VSLQLHRLVAQARLEVAVPVCTVTLFRGVCDVRLLGGFAETCNASLIVEDTRCDLSLHRLKATVCDTLWTRTCKDPERLRREVDKAANSNRSDLRRAAERVAQGLATGDKRTVYLALRDIDPPCAHLFDYTA
jgi:hypothetical protein